MNWPERMLMRGDSSTAPKSTQDFQGLIKLFLGCGQPVQFGDAITLFGFNLGAGRGVPLGHYPRSQSNPPAIFTYRSG